MSPHSMTASWSYHLSSRPSQPLSYTWKYSTVPRLCMSALCSCIKGYASAWPVQAILDHSFHGVTQVGISRERKINKALLQLSYFGARKLMLLHIWRVLERCESEKRNSDRLQDTGMDKRPDADQSNIQYAEPRMSHP